jgi:hypothetical protein
MGAAADLLLRVKGASQWDPQSRGAALASFFRRNCHAKFGCKSAAYAANGARRIFNH